MTAYEYQIIDRPTADELNRYGAEGYRVHQTIVDPRDGQVTAVIMERELLIENGVARVPGRAKAAEGGKRGN